MSKLNIKPIETEYNGYLFRSRLEARWAVFFDAAGIEYQYEPEGFIGWNGTMYLPDFYLPQFDIYAEVKGTDTALYQDAEKLIGAIDFSATPVSKGLLLLGNIPYSEDKIPYFNFLYNDEVVVQGTAAFDFCSGQVDLFVSNYFDWKAQRKEMGYSTPYRAREGYWLALEDSYMTFDVDEQGGACGATTKCRYIDPSDTPIYSEPFYINNYYKKARQARFEHRNQDRRK